MECKKCGSTNTNVQIVNNKVKTNNAGVIYWSIRLMLILCTCGLWLLVPTRRSNSKIKNKKILICQNCGHTEYIK